MTTYTALFESRGVGRVWMSSATYGPKSRRSHHLSWWSTVPESSDILVAPDVGSFIDQWELGMRVARIM